MITIQWMLAIALQAPVQDPPRPPAIPVATVATVIDSREPGLILEPDGARAWKIEVPGASWLCVEFAEHLLADDSAILLVAQHDGASQVFDQATMEEWSSHSALFSGDALELRFYGGSRDPAAFFRIERVLAGWLPLSSDGGAVCGDEGKVPFVDNRIGRLMLFIDDCVACSGTGSCTCLIGTCTAFRLTNGAFVSAGHCFDELMSSSDMFAQVEFNVPASEPSGALNPPSAEDQFPVDLDTVVFQNVGKGQDWAVFGVGSNIAGDSPHESYGLPLRASRENPSAGQTVRVTGFGSDEDGTQNCVSQTGLGTYKDEYIGGPSDIDHEFFAPATPGNSGGPLIWEKHDLAIGNVTYGYCGPFVEDSNLGTSFEVDLLEAALTEFTGPEVRFADAGHPLPVNQNGTIFRPFDTVAEAALAVPSGGILSVVAGSYKASQGNTFKITKPMSIQAPCGPAVIGN